MVVRVQATVEEVHKVDVEEFLTLNKHHTIGQSLLQPSTFAATKNLWIQVLKFYCIQNVMLLESRGMLEEHVSVLLLLEHIGVLRNKVDCS